MTATVSVRFSEDAPARVQSYLRLTASTWIRCCTYDDAAPILTLRDGPADIVITNPGKGEVTDDDVAFGRQLADAAAQYAAELVRIAAQTRPPVPQDQGDVPERAA